MRSGYWLTSLILTTLMCAACSGNPGTAVEQSADQPAIFPDYCDVTIPVNIAPLNFGQQDAHAIKAVFSLNGEERLTATGEDHISIDEAKWHELLTLAQGKQLTVGVSVWNTQHSKGIAYQPFTISVVTDSIDSWLCYRLIDPGYESWGNMGIYQRNLSNFDEKPIVTNHDNRARCVNCHSFADYNPQTMMFHQRSVDPATVIVHDGKVERVNLKDIGIHRQGLYCKWHPSGKYILFSNNGTHQSFLDHGRKVLEVYDTFSSLFLYNVKTGEVTTDSLLYNDTAMQTFATWSPDGQDIYYCTAPQAEHFPESSDSVHYSIVRMGFEAVTGHFDHIPDTIYHADEEGGSASFPRISRDGRYLLFTEAANGTFPVYHPEASLQIIDLQTRQRVDTDILSSPQSESYHDWSSTGRWIVFQSRRMDGRHTRLMLAYFDQSGHVHKPFMLPQRHPEDNWTRLASYNIPEFVRGEVTQHFE